MKITRFIFTAACALTAVLYGCTREIAETETAEAGTVLHITVGNDYLTRSALTTSGNSQHIEHMYVYLFREEEGEFRCFHAADAGWTPVEGEAPADFSYRIGKDAGIAAMGNLPVRVLVVAVDNHPETYSFPSGSGTDHIGNAAGLSFDEVCASVAETASGADDITGTPEAKAYAMAHTELFSGTAEAMANDQTIEVTVDRCVAGVLCYLTDIPYLVESGDRESRTHTVELRLNRDLDLNTSVTLTGETSEGSAPLHGGQPLQEDVVIASADLSSCTQPQGESGIESSLLYIPAVDDGTVKTLENSVLFGAYLVPVSVAGDESFNSQDATLNIVIIGNRAGGGEPYEKYFPVRNTADGNEATEDHPVAIDGRDFNYSLQANRLYAIGSKPESGDTDGDRPASLAGDKLELDVIPWTDTWPSVEFPSYSPSASFIPDFAENSIFDCIGTTLTVTVLPAAGGGQWRITPELDGNFNDGLRFHVNDGIHEGWTSETYISPAQVSGTVTVDIAITDYVRENYLKDMSVEQKIEEWRNDYRTARLILETAASDIRDTVEIRQYNAFTVKITGRDEYCGFARQDALLTEYDKELQPELDYELGDTRGFSYTGWGFGTNDPWGYLGKDDSDYNGEENCTAAYDHCVTGQNRPNLYYGSALYRGRMKWSYFEDAVSEDYSNRYWYTPARYEMQGFFEEVAGPLAAYYAGQMPFDGDFDNNYDNNIVPVANVKYGRLYWSSSSSINWAYETWAYSVPDNTEGDGTDRDGGTRAYIRQARKFR